MLLSPFASVSAIAWHSYRLPPALVLDRFDSRSAVVALGGPFLLFHGRHDPVIPYWHAAQLADARPDARLVSWECGHNDCPPSWDALWSEVGRFMTALPD